MHRYYRWFSLAGAILPVGIDTTGRYNVRSAVTIKIHYGRREP